MRLGLEEIERSIRASFDHSDVESTTEKTDDEVELQWAAIERLPTFRRLRTSLFDPNNNSGEMQGKKVVTDVTRLGDIERRLFVDKLINNIEEDNRRLLRKLKSRIDKVGVKLPTVELRYSNLCVDAKVKLVHGKPMPTLWNSLKTSFSVCTFLACITFPPNITHIVH
ncbi:drug-responsive transcription factor pdr3 [Ranunculus cassubicifolius]